MAPAEVSIDSLRRMTLTINEKLNNEMLAENLDLVEEQRGQALIRLQNYQQSAARYYNKKVKGRSFDVGDLVLRETFQNTAEEKAGKLGVHWEGPYSVTRVVRPGVYELATTDVEAVPRAWNLAHLRRYYY